VCYALLEACVFRSWGVVFPAGGIGFNRVSHVVRGAAEVQRRLSTTELFLRSGLNVTAARTVPLEVVNASKQVLDLFSVTNVLSLFEGTGRCGGKLM
jgi:hypothetical protein